MMLAPGCLAGDCRWGRQVLGLGFGLVVLFLGGEDIRGLTAEPQLELPAKAGSSGPGPTVVLEVEEDVYTFRPAKNGAGPMWCRGSTCLVRVGDKVFASGLETIPDVQPLNNCRWLLFTREDNGEWHLVATDPAGRTREPCPLVALPPGRVLLSGNPTLTGLEARAGPAQPEVWVFAADRPKDEPVRILPVWDGEPPFTEHSYRSFAADGLRGEWILFQNIGYSHAEWSFCDAQGGFRAGRLTWPIGHEYPKPQPIRICYPTVALRDRAVYFCGVSDILEPYPEWRAYKRELTGQDWDYDFRRLFYTWCEDIARGEFQPWVEISTRDKTAGWITPCDLRVEESGRVHILWTERAIDERLRPKFFPEEKQWYELRWGVISAGKLERLTVLLRAEEGGAKEIPGFARFHITPNGRLFAIYYVYGHNQEGKRVAENRLVELYPNGGFSSPSVIPLEHPFDSFFTATPRAGCQPDWRLDLLGTSPRKGKVIRYARLRIVP